MKRIICYSIITVLIFVTFSFISCGGATEFEEDAPHHQPISNTLKTGMIGFQKAVSEIPPSKIIGGLYTGVFKKLQQEYYATGYVSDQYQRTYEDVVTTELSKANYETISKNNVFDTAKATPRFLLGAILTDARINYYVMKSGNGLITYENNADALLSIKWQLYDTQEKKIIVTIEELGTFRDAESDLFAYRESVRVSFKNFLAEKKLVETLSSYLKDNPIKP